MTNRKAWDFVVGNRYRPTKLKKYYKGNVTPICGVINSKEKQSAGRGSQQEIDAEKQEQFLSNHQSLPKMTTICESKALRVHSSRQKFSS